MTNRPAHTIKPGDKINGVEVFDVLRRGFGGWFIPLVDGTRHNVASQDTIITCS